MNVKAVIAVVGLTAGLVQAQVTTMRPVLKPSEVSFAPVTACFAEGTDPVYVNRVNVLVEQLNRLQFGVQDYQLTGRWSGAQGSPRALTWSFVPDGLSISGGIGEPAAPSVLFSSMDAAFAAQGGRATWVNRFVQVFARWQALSGLTYTRITVGGNDWDDGAVWGSAGAAGVRGDCRISAHPLDGANGVLAYNQFPSNGDMVLDSQDTGNWASTGNANRFLRNVVAHEHGHGMGLLHVCPASATKLMEPFISTAYDGPRQDDIRAAQRQYGDPYELNDTAATAKPMGALAIPGSIAFGTQPAPVAGTSDANAALLTIDADGESDFWSFTVAATASVTATVTPVGTNYLQAAQNGDGSCPAGTAFNALAVADLVVSIIGSDGTTVLGTGNASAVGVAETLSSIILPGAGTYYLRVTEANSPAESQSYRINLSAVSGVVVCPTFTQQPLPQTVCQGTNVQFSVAVSGTPTPGLQWYRNNVLLPGQTNTTLNLSLVSPGLSSGTYTCVATTGSCSPVTSDPATLAVNTVINIDTQPNPSQTVNAGSPVSFTVASTSTPTATYQWRKGGNNIGGATGPTYTINSTVPGDAGNYDCVMTNPCDQQISDVAQLFVNGAAPCYANCDESSTPPVLTANDFQCFLNNYAANLPSANCDGSTSAPTLTANDFQCFLNAFAAGCP